MNRKEVYKKRGENVFRVDKIFNLKINKLFLHHEYKLKTPETISLSETGLLILFIIEPIENFDLPSFSARWDQNLETLDIDISNTTHKISILFKAEKEGYLGHHPKNISQNPRTYNVHIAIPQYEIFNSNISFNINRTHAPELFKN